MKMFFKKMVEKGGKVGFKMYFRQNKVFSNHVLFLVAEQLYTHFCVCVCVNVLSFCYGIFLCKTGFTKKCTVSKIIVQ